MLTYPAAPSDSSPADLLVTRSIHSTTGTDGTYPTTHPQSQLDRSLRRESSSPPFATYEVDGLWRYQDAAALEAEEAARQAAGASAAREAERAAEVARMLEEEKDRLAAEAARVKEAPSRGGRRGRGVVRAGTGRGRGGSESTFWILFLWGMSGRVRHTDDEYSSTRCAGYKDTCCGNQEAHDRSWTRGKVRRREEQRLWPGAKSDIERCLVCIGFAGGCRGCIRAGCYWFTQISPTS